MKISKEDIELAYKNVYIRTGQKASLKMLCDELNYRDAYRMSVMVRYYFPDGINVTINDGDVYKYIHMEHVKRLCTLPMTHPDYKDSVEHSGVEEFAEASKKLKAQNGDKRKIACFDKKVRMMRKHYDAVRNMKDVYNAVYKYHAIHKYMPSVNELIEITGINSRKTVLDKLQRLINEGYLETDVNGRLCSRAYRIGRREFC